MNTLFFSETILVQVGKNMSDIESVIGYSFRNKDLLWQSITHKTYARTLGTPDIHNEWLAIFGDNVLDLIVVEYLYQVYSNRYGNGFLSNERDKLVRNDNLEKLAKKIQLHNFLRVTPEVINISPKIIPDSFEALLAAIYFDSSSTTVADQGLDMARSWFTDQFLDSVNPNSNNHVIHDNINIVALVEVEQAISYTFDNKALLQTALTKRSHAILGMNPENHNDGLALLGDAVLDVVVLEYLYQNKDIHEKGFLSDNRDHLVRNTLLKVIAQKLKLENFILNNGITGDESLTNGVEALIAAIYQDRGLRAARDWVFSHLPHEIIAETASRLLPEPTQVPTRENLSANSLISTIGVDYSKLNTLLSQAKWYEADRETREAMLQVLGRTDYLPKELIDEFPCEDLGIIDQLWVHYSGGRFGFSIQSSLLQEVMEDWTSFGERVGWRKDQVGQSKVERIYDLQAPRGHLPSAALRAAGSGKSRMLILKRFAKCKQCDMDD